MKIDSNNVYERPVAEEISLTVEYPIAGSQNQNTEDPDDPGTETEI